MQPKVACSLRGEVTTVPRPQQLVRRVVSQFMHPRGLSGHLVGWEMALRPSNRKRNVWAVSVMDVQPDDRVLEIGFGPGIAVREIARRDTWPSVRHRSVGGDVRPGCASQRGGDSRGTRSANGCLDRNPTAFRSPVRQNPGCQQHGNVVRSSAATERAQGPAARRRGHRDRFATPVSRSHGPDNGCCGKRDRRCTQCGRLRCDPSQKVGPQASRCVCRRGCGCRTNSASV